MLPTIIPNCAVFGAGSTADGLTLFERLEQRLEEHPGQLKRAAVELAKAWRQDRILRHLEVSTIIKQQGLLSMHTLHYFVSAQIVGPVPWAAIKAGGSLLKGQECI